MIFVSCIAMLHIYLLLFPRFPRLYAAEADYALLSGSARATLL